jgi:hypothetical protein
MDRRLIQTKQGEFREENHCSRPVQVHVVFTVTILVLSKRAARSQLGFAGRGLSCLGH